MNQDMLTGAVIFLAGMIVSLILLAVLFGTDLPKPKCDKCGQEKPVSYISIGPHMDERSLVLCDDCAKSEKLDLRSRFASEEAYQEFLRRHPRN